MAPDRHALVRRYPDGREIYAWLERINDEPQIKVHWREPSGKPAAQPFWIHLSVADQVFEQLAAFAKEMKVIDAEGAEE